MKTLELIAGIISLSIFVGFIVWSCIHILKSVEPDETNAQTRYTQTMNITKNKKQRA